MVKPILTPHRQRVIKAIRAIGRPATFAEIARWINENCCAKTEYVHENVRSISRPLVVAGMLEQIDPGRGYLVMLGLPGAKVEPADRQIISNQRYLFEGKRRAIESGVLRICSQCERVRTKEIPFHMGEDGIEQCEYCHRGWKPGPKKEKPPPAPADSILDENLQLKARVDLLEKTVKFLIDLNDSE